MSERNNDFIEIRKLKRAVIKEELLAISGNYVNAIILNQFLYWAERVSDFDKYKEQENRIAINHGEPEQELYYGWIYKSAEELSSETMLNMSNSNIRAHVKELIEMGFISERRNPKYKWDKTLQYRVNYVNVCIALSKLGYSLDGCFIEKLPCSNLEICSSKTEPCNSNLENQNEQNRTAIPEITTYTTTENTNITNNILNNNKLNNNKINNSNIYTIDSTPNKTTTNTKSVKYIYSQVSKNSEKSEKTKSKKDKFAEDCKEIIDYLNQRTGSKYRTGIKATNDLIAARMKEGFTVEDFKQVIDNKVATWLNDRQMNKFLRPMTLFAAKKFESYLNEKKESDIGVSNKPDYYDYIKGEDSL